MSVFIKPITIKLYILVIYYTHGTSFTSWASFRWKI